jgi:DNA-binding FrmR family transcriptional regulator
MEDSLGAAARHKSLNRLRRAQGQLTAVIAAVEADQPCRDVAVQLAAVSKAIDRAACHLLVTELRSTCAAEAAADGPPPDLTPDEIEKLFMMLT